ncbi:serine hydrolase domain-containing protein [Asanoa siamensis]|uniref:Serine hydrolase n=1 Tax=Asanoa siamensis TaxID=926357 RepID=A0ABQ4CU41_9ACTN|nr:serine hydrolase domain-containing protein [Asanoa siamensis]GIF74362.1 serine hydrolase [Asanoa siamensis]
MRALAAVATVAALAATPASAVDAPPDAAGPPTVTSADIRFARPPVTLRHGNAREAGLTPRYVDRIQDTIASFLQPSPTHPMYPGAVALAGQDGVIVAHDAVGHALRYADAAGTDLPRDQWVPTRRDTVFDVASMTKLFTAIAAVQLVESGRLVLDVNVVRYLPEFGAHGKGHITIRNLLTHTSGLPADPNPSLCAYPTPEEQWAALFDIAPLAPPNTQFLYADTNMMVLGKVIETITGQRLDRVVERGITGPLHMRETMFNPPASLRPRIAATEYQPGRGLVRGSVQDENAYCMGGVSGHAGVFSTARDLATLAQALLNGGAYGRARILSSRSTRALFTDYNGAFPTHAHGLGFELDQRRYMGALSSPVTAGHTGFTGTSIVLDPLAHSFAILLTNRVHPTREWGNNNPSRAAVGTDLARALPVRPSQGPTAWYADGSGTLTIPLRGGTRLAFDLWYDTADTDAGAVEASTDGGRTWRLVPLLLRAPGHRWHTDGTFSGFEGRQWLTVAASLPAGTTDLRWRATTGAPPQGRGIYVDAVRVHGPSGVVVFDDRRPRDAALFRAHGWTASRD